MSPSSTSGTCRRCLPAWMRRGSLRAGLWVWALLAGCFPDLELPPHDVPADAGSFDAAAQDANMRVAGDGGSGTGGRVGDMGDGGAAVEGGAGVRARAERRGASDASGGTAAPAGAEASGGRGGAGGSGAAGTPGRAGAGGAGEPGGSGGMGGVAGAPDAAGAGAGGQVVGGGGSGGSQVPEQMETCFDWVSVRDITQATPPADAWKAGQERVADGHTFDQYICRGDPNGGDMLQIGKGSFGYGCYVPSAGAETNATSDVMVLVSSAQPECLAWVSPSGQALPSAAVQQDGVLICRAHHTGVTSFNGATSDGEHIGQVRSDASTLGCAFEFYGATLVESSDFEVLVYSSREM